LNKIYYTEEHEWLKVIGDIGICGITEFAQDQLGDIVYVELPEVGLKVVQGEEIGVVESVKAASEVYAPVSGEVIETNNSLEENPAQVNEDAIGEGWFLRIRISDPAELQSLLSQEAYSELIAEQG